MTASFLPSARPPKVAIAWATRDGLFCEIPCASGPPLIVRYRATPEGLAIALHVLLEAPDHSPAPKPTADHPFVHRPALTFNEGEREQVRGILKNLKIT